jgi:butyryl-CoA dehydrogenase
MSFRAPVDDILFSMRHVAGLERLSADGLYPEATPDLVEAVVTEAGRFAEARIAPLNRDGDRIGARFEAGRVTTAPGWRDAYAAWAESGWNGLTGPTAHGGQALPLLVNAGCVELWNSAAMAFGIGPVLTMGAVEALVAHGSEELRARYLDRLVSGEWMGTMNLTEPQAGSDLAALRTRAERRDDGTYRVFGQKIFITYGEHDLTENIVHLVLARLPDAPAGTRGISLFLVPKILPDGRRNDLVCAGIETKLGIHGAPTCTMQFGEGEGAVAWLVGEEHRGLACMFTMMNNARLAVGLQGVAIAERATQQAFAYARERRQGRAAGVAGEGMAPIILHPDVRRMLVEMRAKTVAARGICYLLAAAIDRSHHEATAQARGLAASRAALLTPIAKAFSTDIGIEVASLGVQVHGGMGFIEETGAAQHYRDARIAAIYEGTNGIQAIDLATRKVPLDDGRALAALLDESEAVIDRAGRSNAGIALIADALRPVADEVRQASAWMGEAVAKRPEDALAAATPYMRLVALLLGGTVLLREAEAAAPHAGGDPLMRLRVDTARFFATQVAPAADGLARGLVEGVEALGAPLPTEA